jgi:hypothetical protein
MRARAEAPSARSGVALAQVATEAGVAPLLKWEGCARLPQSGAPTEDRHIGRFLPLCDFDWNWPKRCDCAAIDALLAGIQDRAHRGQD